MLWILSISRFSFFCFGAFGSLGKITIGIYMRGGLEKSKTGASSTLSATRKLISFNREHFMLHAVLVVGCSVDSRYRDFVPRPVRPIGHTSSF